MEEQKKSFATRQIEGTEPPFAQDSEAIQRALLEAVAQSEENQAKGIVPPGNWLG